MNPSDPRPPRDLPREPVPKSFRPAWIWIGLMALVVVAMGVIAAIVALLVQ